MTGAAIEIRPEGLERLNVRIGRLLAGLKNLEPLMRNLAVAGENQTRKRLEQEKHGPNGEIWPEWSPAYAATRHGGQSLLEGKGHLLDSLTAFADAQTAGWGTNVKYAAIHQFGGKAGRNRQVDIPARPYFGVSDDNEQEFLDITERYLDRLLEASA